MQIMDLVPDLRPVILAARQVRDERNSLERFLPNVAVQALSYRLGRRRKVDQTVPVRAFGSPATPIRRPGIVEVRGELPAVTPIVNLTETDLNLEFILAQQLNGQQVDWSPWVEQAAGLAALATDNTYELMRGQALSTGIVSLATEDGEVHEVDFGIAAEQKIAVDAGDNFWDAFEAGHEVFHDTSGAAAGVFVTTAKTYRKALSSLQALFPQQPVGQTSLNAYAADRGLPSITTYDRVLRAEDGSKTRIYPEGYGTFLPAGDSIGRTELGVTQEAVQQVQGQILSPLEVAGMTIQTLGQDNPVERAVKAASVGLPVIQDNEDIVILSGLEGTV
ncbi:major capsid protein [Nocardioides bruguierae]|uniref:Major capsid protein n=1 Tax=Nocardioides bruguierae TaxID=2945102 RepID=A0A9X2DC77_9ACTN|nr:major capsid protein [Nocardioides bruguierae]MCM0622712.1 major capsid protein [Nocardioides bruguierae]